MSDLGQANLAPARVRKGDGRRARGNRSGFTTRACAPAAARAATLGLLTGVLRLAKGRRLAPFSSIRVVRVESRISALEIKLGLAEDHLEALNRTVSPAADRHPSGADPRTGQTDAFS